MKSKNVKLPVELVELIEKRNHDRPPGEVLLGIYKEYMRLEELASTIQEKRQDLGKATVYEILKTDRDQFRGEVTEIKKEIEEACTMLKGLELFFTKVRTK